MEEYILKTASNEEWQKWLNQWKHTYVIEFINTHLNNDGKATILIKRTPKNPNP